MWNDLYQLKYPEIYSGLTTLHHPRPISHETSDIFFIRLVRYLQLLAVSSSVYILQEIYLLKEFPGLTAYSEWLTSFGVPQLASQKLLLGSRLRNSCKQDQLVEFEQMFEIFFRKSFTALSIGRIRLPHAIVHHGAVPERFWGYQRICSFEGGRWLKAVLLILHKISDHWVRVSGIALKL